MHNNLPETKKEHDYFGKYYKLINDHEYIDFLYNLLNSRDLFHLSICDVYVKNT